MEKTDYNNSEIAKQYMRLAVECGIWESEYKIIAQYADISKPILDVGCGAGRITAGMHDIGFCSIYGIDYSENMLMYARKITPADYNINYLRSDITSEMIWPEGFFGTIVFGYNGLMCIQGNNNRRKAVGNIEKLLCSKGIFIFTVQERPITQEHRWIEFWQNREKILRRTNNCRFYVCRKE